MSDIQHIDVDSEEFEGTPKALRDYAKRLRKELEAEKQATVELRGQLQSAALADVLAGFSKPERVKSALLSDKVDPLDSEAVSKWIEENGDDFAKAAAAPAASNEDQTAEPQGGRERLDVSQIGQPGSSDALSVIKSVPKDLSPQETRQWLIDHGA